MPLVEIARFVDVTEAQAAAAALRASGLEVFVQNEGVAQTLGYMQLGLGGVRLWTPAEDAAAAKAFITDHRGAPSRLPPRGGAFSATASVLLELLGGPLFGWIVPVLTGRRRRAPDDAAASCAHQAHGPLSEGPDGASGATRGAEASQATPR